MTVGSVGSGGNHFIALAAENASMSDCTTVSGELALLMLETQEQQKLSHQEQLASARSDFSEQLANDVQALRDQADASFRGALFSSGAAIVSGGLGAWAAGRKCEDPWQSSVGKAFGDLSQPLGAAVGKTYGAANAKAAEGAEEAAKWQMEDARSAIQDAKGLQNKALDWASSITERDAATKSAILSNKA